MLTTVRSRRRSPYGAYYLCAVVSALLLLLSVSLLYSRLSLSSSTPFPFHFHGLSSDSLLSDEHISTSASEDRIDELDIVEEQQEEEEEEDDDDNQVKVKVPSGYFFDPLTASIRRSFTFNRRGSIQDHQWDADHPFLLASPAEDRCKAAFGSDDVAVDEEVRTKVTQVMGIEDALFLRGSPLREGWGHWFDKKAVFLRKDKMFKSNWDVLNNNPMLQDPDAAGVTGFTRGDRIVHKWWINEFKKVPFPGIGNKILRQNYNQGKEFNMNIKNKIELDRESTNGVHKGLDASVDDDDDGHGALTSADNRNSGTNKYSVVEERVSETTRLGKSVDHVGQLSHIYADGNSWGYYPGLPLHLTFTDFMDAFFRMGKCDKRVFMVWNSPPWMFGVRHQRGLESLLFHHPDACVVVFSETIELDFFKDNFVHDGYKVAVAMPNLDELLKDTPTHIFSSVWFQWRKTKFYSTHYSELIRLAALYKYGGIYLDSDIIVLKPISFLNNSVGMEDHVAGGALNGAVMAFGRDSLFIKECLEEFYLTYDDTSLRWNGADLLTRVARKFLGEENKSIKRLQLKVEPSYFFFPISSQKITRYFIAPATETEKAQQDVLLERILHESLTFHFWNSLTYALIPEPDSLVARLMNYACIRCLELL